MHRKVNSKSGTKFQSWIIAFREPRPGYLSISLYVWQGDRKVCTQAFTDSPKRNYKIVIHCNSVFIESCIQGSRVHMLSSLNITFSPKSRSIGMLKGQVHG